MYILLYENLIYILTKAKKYDTIFEIIGVVGYDKE